MIWLGKAIVQSTINGLSFPVFLFLACVICSLDLESGPHRRLQTFVLKTGFQTDGGVSISFVVFCYVLLCEHLNFVAALSLNTAGLVFQYRHYICVIIFEYYFRVLCVVRVHLLLVSLHLLVYVCGLVGWIRLKHQNSGKSLRDLVTCFIGKS